MADLVWIHEDALRATHPVFEAVSDGARVVFIWDSARFDAAFIGSKRQLFIYQTLVEMDVDIIAGQTADMLSSLVAAEDVDRLVVAETPNSAIHAALGTVHRNFPDLQIDIQGQGGDGGFFRLLFVPHGHFLKVGPTFFTA